jgi:hypothetical protein
VSVTRIYLPLGSAACRALSERRLLDGTPLAAHAVTRALEVTRPGVGEEVYEHLALQAAARTALEEARSNGDRVVVAAADVDTDLVEDRAGQKDDPSSVQITDVVPLQRIASFHVADSDIALSAPAEDEDLELSWYDATELSVLLELL